MFENGFYSILEFFANLCNGFSSIFDTLFNTQIGGVSLISVLFGAGLTVFVGWVVVKWVIP